MDWRFSTIKVGFVILFVGIVLRLFQIMVLEHGEYMVLAKQQHIAEWELTALRGEIFTSDGTPLVVNAPSYLMFAVPKDMEDKEKNVEQLVETIYQRISISDIRDTDTTEDEEPIPLRFPTSIHTLELRYNRDEEGWKDTYEEEVTEELLARLSNDENYFVQILNHITPEEKGVFEELQIEGIYFQLQQIREYPEGSLAAHVLGFVGKSNDGSDRGYFGLEGYYDGYLSGRSGYEIVERDIEGKRIPYAKRKVTAPSHGRNLVLTIKREYQYMIEKKLAEGVERYRAESGSAILLDPWSGAVWAMASYPSYYPEYWSDVIRDENDVSQVTVFRNTAISNVYEPGSVMKPVTMSMALNEGIVTPSTIYHDTGPVTYSGYQVRTCNDQYHGDITMMQILQLSDNTGAAWVGHQVGSTKFAHYLDKYQFGSTLGIDLQGEEAGIVADSDQWRDINLANISFGQGVSVTPLQMVTAIAAVINGGTVYKPYIVDQIIDVNDDGVEQVIETSPQVLTHPIDAFTSEQMRYMLQKVVTDGEFTWFVHNSGMDEYDIGGKTGTAQIPINGQYDPNKTNTTFVGFGPVDEPQYVMIVKLTKPSTSSYSADTVVPLWMDMARELSDYFQIPPKSVE